MAAWPPPQQAGTSSDQSYAQHVHQATLAAPLEPLREQDRLLPAAKISRDAKYFMQVGQLALNPPLVAMPRQDDNPAGVWPNT
jgi:hypothetical protein